MTLDKASAAEQRDSCKRLVDRTPGTNRFRGLAPGGIVRQRVPHSPLAPSSDADLRAFSTTCLNSSITAGSLTAGLGTMNWAGASRIGRTLSVRFEREAVHL